QLRNQSPIGYDYLIVAVGNRPTYYGNDHFQQYAPHLKSIDNALTIRDRILISFEMASREPDREKRRKYLTFVMVGGGPTGVEMAGAISEIGPKILKDEFSGISPEELRIFLLEGADRVLLAYDESLSDRARRDLEDMGVKVVLNKMVDEIGEDYVKADDLELDTVNIVWAAGNEGVPVLKTLETEQLKDGRIVVGKDLALPDDPNVFVLGDAAAIEDMTGNYPKYLPGVAQVAIQCGKYAARIIKNDTRREFRQPFKYFDRGNMATIGRGKAILETGKLKLGGFLAWVGWSIIHVMYLIGFRNRVKVMVEWIWYYLSFQPGSRIIYWREETKKTFENAGNQPQEAPAEA
ncbi:MAG: NAD(P)/FAD-dependent oxidoreductase, partial [Bacteroidota bacterium]